MTLSRAVTWVPPSFLAARVAKTTSYLAVGGDSGKLLDFTSAGTLTLTAAATLGNSWRVWVYNSSSGVVPIDPNGSETIRTPSGTSTTVTLAQGESILLVCTGTAFEGLA